MAYLDSVLYMISGLGAFMIGFKLTSDGVKAVSGGGLKKLFEKTSKSALAGAGVGVAATALVQSSSVTTVMVVGFVNAGFMTLKQAAAVIMGANVGTTVTAQIAALESFDFIKYAMALSAVGIFINLFARKEKTKSIGTSLAGLGLLFLGMRFMSDSMAVIRDSEKVVEALTAVKNPFLLLAIGAVITAVIQSSAAVTAIIISMAGAGIAVGGGGNAVYFLILGTNIGTCFTAVLSAVGAGTNAKRAAFIHFAFNFIGSAIFSVVLIFWKNFSYAVMDPTFPVLTTRIAMFHTFFNVSCAILFLPFINFFVFVATKLFRGKKNGADLDERLLQTPAIALGHTSVAIKKSLISAMESVNRALKRFFEGIKDDGVKENNEKLSLIVGEIEGYLTKIGANNNGLKLEVELSNYSRILTDIKRVGELADNLVKYAVKSEEEDIKFSPQANKEIDLMAVNLTLLFESCKSYLDGKMAATAREADIIEERIDGQKKSALENHLKRLADGECKMNTSSVFVNMISDLERIGDHLNKIVHTV